MIISKGFEVYISETCSSVCILLLNSIRDEKTKRVFVDRLKAYDTKKIEIIEKKDLLNNLDKVSDYLVEYVEKYYDKFLEFAITKNRLYFICKTTKGIRLASIGVINPNKSLTPTKLTLEDILAA